MHGVYRSSEPYINQMAYMLSNLPLTERNVKSSDIMKCPSGLLDMFEKMKKDKMSIIIKQIKESIIKSIKK